MRYTELKDKSLSELRELLHSKKQELFVMRVRLRTMQLTNTSQISATRKDIARISTLISQKKSDAS